MIAEGAHILDLGTGTGNVAVAAAKHVGSRGHVIGVDLSEGLLHEAGRRAGDLPVEFRQMDAEALGFADAAFDVVVSSLLAGVHMVRVLRLVRRVLRPGGRAVFASYTENARAIGRTYMVSNGPARDALPRGAVRPPDRAVGT